MIGSLRGTVLERVLDAEKTSGECLVEVLGVGYWVTATVSTLGNLKLNEESLIYIYHHIREDDQKLYGFNSLVECKTFISLLSTHGVGPSLALAVMVTYNLSQLATILAEDDIDSICEIPGVGKKTAQRLMVELKSSIGDLDASRIVIDDTVSSESINHLSDVKEALTNLGYSSAEISNAIKQMTAEADMSTDSQSSADLLKKALRLMAG